MKEAIPPNAPPLRGKEAHNADEASGIFTNLTRLASQLKAGGGAVPLITIETDESSTLVKAYDGGHTVALTVPVLQTHRAAVVMRLLLIKVMPMTS